MKTTITFLKLSAIIGSFLTLSIQPALASIEPASAVDIYVCGTETVTLKYDEGGYTLQSGDVVVWAMEDGAAVEKPFNGDLASVSYEVPLNELTESGLYTFRAQVMSADPAKCAGDASAPIEVYKLPELALTVDAEFQQYCAEAAGAESQSVITAKTTTSVPIEVLLEYTWSATKGAASVDPIDGIGTAEENNTVAQDIENTFTLDTKEEGVYAFTASVQYAGKDANGITIKGGCSATSNTPATVTVTPKPGTPLISVE